MPIIPLAKQTNETSGVIQPNDKTAMGAKGAVFKLFLANAHVRHRLGPEIEVNVLFMEQRPSQRFGDSHEAAFEFTTLLLKVVKPRWTCVALSLALLFFVITAN